MNNLVSDVKSNERPESFWDIIQTIVYAVLIAFVVRTFVFEPFNIPSSSMLPTLLVGDYLFVSKYSYGYSRHSLPFSLPLISGRIFFTQPERGDVVVFKLPRDNETDYIKRIIGLPGDRIKVDGGILHINGLPVKRERIGEYVTHDGYGSFARLALYRETLPNGRSHEILEASDDAPLDNTDEYVVPDGHYFVMGDNRDNSLDSRVLHGVGFVPKENLIGRAVRMFFSHDGSARLWEIWKWPFAIRYGRLLRAIE